MQNNSMKVFYCKSLTPLYEALMEAFYVNVVIFLQAKYLVTVSRGRPGVS